MRAGVALGSFLVFASACDPLPAADDASLDASVDAAADSGVDDRPRRLIGWRAAAGAAGGIETVELDPATGAGVPLRYEPGVVEWRSPVVDEAEGALYLIGTREGRDAQGLFTLGAEDAALTGETELDGPIEGLFLDADRRLLAARRVGERQIEIVEVDVASGVTRLVAVIDDLASFGGASFAWDAATDRVYQASGNTLFVVEASTGRLVARLPLAEPLSCLHVTRNGELRALVVDATSFDTVYVSISTDAGAVVELARHDAIVGCDEARASDRHGNRLYLRTAYRRDPATVRLLTFDSETGELLAEPFLLEEVTALGLLEPTSMPAP